MLDPKMTIEEVKGLPYTSEEFYRYLIDRLRVLGYEIREFTSYQFRIEGVLDVYPVNRRWHDIKKNKRGGYEDIFAFVQRYLPVPQTQGGSSVKVHYDE